MIFIKRKPGMTRKEFERYWLSEHASFFHKLPDIKRYVVNIVQLPESADSPYDGVAELWYDDLNALKRIDDSAELKQFLSEDNPRFQDVTLRRSVIVEEHVVIQR